MRGGPLLRRGARAASRTRLFDVVIDALERVDRGRTGIFSVLTYHRIGYPEEPSDLDPRLISATPEALEAQMAYLVARKSVICLRDLLDVRRGHALLPPHAVLVTFDDAYRDFGDLAWPILRRHGVSATLFVPTGYPDRPERAFWWDRVHAAIRATRRTELRLAATTLPLADASDRLGALQWVSRQVQALDHGRALALVAAVEAALEVAPARGAVLTWDEIRRLSGEGLAVAPHTRTHPLLTRVDAVRAGEEIAGSAADMAREVGSFAPAFAYPDGSHDGATVTFVREAGYELAFTTRRGGNAAGRTDWHRLHRINVGAGTPLAGVRAQLVHRPAQRRVQLGEGVG